MKRSEWADAWYQQALHELEAARVLRRESFWDTCSLMCQQAAEKAVKAVWIDAKSDDPPRTHWAEELAEKLGAPGDVVDAASVLVAGYTVTRYPEGPWGGPPFLSYSQEDADDSIVRAELVLVWAHAQWEAEDGG